VPHLGKIRLADLTSREVTAMFAAIAAGPNRRGQPYAAGTLQRIRATLRAALNGAIREGLLVSNVASRVELPNPRRPHPVVWTEQQIAHWKRTGVRPVVAVWSPRQLAGFLGYVRDERLYALWWLVALRGLRRGEAVGLPWDNVDLDRRQLTISQQLTVDAGTFPVSAPKSRASHRVIALDERTVQVLREHARRQRLDQLRAGHAWQQTGYVFTRRDGTPLRPNSVTQRFSKLADRAGLPPVRFHDLRHGAASLAHAAGADLKTIQDQLGHASIVLTADTYTSVFPATQHHAATATARLVLTAARETSERLRRGRSQPNTARPEPDRPPEKSTATDPAQPARAAQTRTKRRNRPVKRGQRQATAVDKGRGGSPFSQVRRWAAGGSNPEPMD